MTEGQCSDAVCSAASSQLQGPKAVSEDEWINEWINEIMLYAKSGGAAQKVVYHSESIDSSADAETFSWPQVQPGHIPKKELFLDINCLGYINYYYFIFNNKRKGHFTPKAFMKCFSGQQASVLTGISIHACC